MPAGRPRAPQAAPCTPRPRILCVDDDPTVLASIARVLGRDHEVSTAEDAKTALDILAREGPFPVVVSDLRMPDVDGLAFFDEVARCAPDSVRILLTGYADLDEALAAVHRGRVFRLLTKPCQREDLIAAIQAGLAQHDLLRTPHELLDRTLRNTVRALTDVLALASPIALGRAHRARKTVLALCARMGVSQTWPIEIATLLSQIGCISLMDETLARLHGGDELSPDELVSVRALPRVARDLLGDIPRIEPVLEILECPDARFAGDRSTGPGPHGADIPFGARLLRVALDLDALELQGTSGARAVRVLRARSGEYDPSVLDALEAVFAAAGSEPEVHELRPGEVQVGMTLAADVLARTGALLVARGQTINDSLLLRLRVLAQNDRIMGPLLVVPAPEAMADAPESFAPVQAGATQTTIASPS